MVKEDLLVRKAGIIKGSFRINKLKDKGVSYFKKMGTNIKDLGQVIYLTVKENKFGKMKVELQLTKANF